MRTIILKVLCCVCVAGMANVSAFQNKHLYQNSKTKDYNKNHRHHTYVNAYKHLTRYNVNSFYNLNSNEVRLRHSRYPNLDSVMTRLDNIQSRSAAITTTSTTTPTSVTTVSPYHIGNKLTDNLFFDSNIEETDHVSGEVDNESWDPRDDEDPFDEEINEDESDNDEFEDEDEKDDVDASWQAEEATTEALPLHSMMDFKSRSRSSPNQIEETSRRKNYPDYPSARSEATAAIQHAVRMNTETRCREPFPRVVSVQSEHPDPSKSYFPHCTVLHRCAEDTGCCPNHATICAPKTQVVVHLYFYSSTITKPGNKIEKLPFTNHTECACLEKPHETTTSENTSPEVARAYRSHLPAKVISPQQTMPIIAPVLPRCKCPEEYTPILLKNSSCTCDCTDSNMDCGLIKRGNEFFSMKDRKCIQEKVCGIPKCEYGTYITTIGRCPRRNEKLGAQTSVH